MRHLPTEIIDKIFSYFQSNTNEIMKNHIKKYKDSKVEYNSVYYTCESLSEPFFYWCFHKDKMIRNNIDFRVRLYHTWKKENLNEWRSILISQKYLDFDLLMNEKKKLMLLYKNLDEQVKLIKMILKK